MNSGFDPLVVAPGKFKIQTASANDQASFHFGGSQVPLHLGMRGTGTLGVSGAMKINRPFVPVRSPFKKSQM
jgi:hypothetical protein